MKTIVILSGGLDSTTLLYHLKAAGHETRAMTFNYGQRHERELEAAKQICELANTPQDLVDLKTLVPLFGGNALTDLGVEVPHGEYAADNIAVTTVPNRNMIMLSVAIGRAISLGFDAVAFGAHGGVNDEMYADCSPAFAAAMSQVAGECDTRSISVNAPFVTWKKHDIVARGVELAVPFELTWSCYEGDDIPCGACGTCLDRDRAFRTLELVDPLLKTTLE
jgi:7-cyano-7-deazaguanine synthase